MFDKREKKRIRLMTRLSIGALGIFLAGFSSQAGAQAVSDAALQAAIQHALPGAVAAHIGKGVAEVQSQGIVSSGPARPVNMSDVPQALHSRESGEETGHDRPLSGLTEEQYQAQKAKLLSQ